MQLMSETEWDELNGEEETSYEPLVLIVVFVVLYPLFLKGSEN